MLAGAKITPRRAAAERLIRTAGRYCLPRMPRLF
jgi:hypothetical protein